MAKNYKYYSSRDLNLKKDVKGAKLWGVALENTMLTYFEVDANTRFEAHSHPNEQITFVLDGELFFKLSGDTIKVSSGEVITISSKVTHAVFTKSKKVKAIDAWSPPIDKYRT